MGKRRAYQPIRIWINDHAYIEHKMLPSNVLEIPEEYQRRIDPAHVQEIVEEFNRAVLNPIKVSHRGGHYWVFDGSHSLGALKEINEGKASFPVECRVFENLTEEEEAELFSLQNGKTKKLPVMNEIRAQVVAKKENTMKLVGATEDSGFSLAINKHGEGAIKALGKTRNIYGKLGEEVYRETLALVKDTWDGRRGSTSSHMLGGVAAFVKEFSGAYDRDRFIKRLREKNPQDILFEAKMHKTDYQTMDTACATEIATIYNKGRGKGKLDHTLVV